MEGKKLAIAAHLRPLLPHPLHSLRLRPQRLAPPAGGRLAEGGSSAHVDKKQLVVVSLLFCVGGRGEAAVRRGGVCHAGGGWRVH